MKKIIPIIFTLFFIACDKKPLPVAEPTEPIFYLKARLNGELLYMGAGEQDYYMSASCAIDTTNVYAFKAELKQISCNSNCGYAIAVIINDKAIVAANQQSHVNETIHPGQFIYNDEDIEPLYYKVVLNPDAPELNDSYSWLFNGAQVNSYMTSAIVEANQVITPTLLFENASGSCGTSHSNTYKVGHALQTKVSASKQTGSSILQYSFTTQTTGTPPFKYSWDFGDISPVSTDQNPIHTYSSQGYYIAELTVTDANNDTCTSFYQVPAWVDTKCEANFSASFTAIPNSKAFSAITILLTDATGKTYSSKGLIQPEASTFEILEVSDYHKNEQNESTKKMKVKFNCVVQHGSEQLLISGAEAVLAVSYK